MALCVSGMRAGGGTTSWTQEIWVLWGHTGGCRLLVIMCSGCRGGAFSSWSSSWENCIGFLELADDSKKLWATCGHCSFAVVVTVDAAGVCVCFVGLNVGRRTIFIVEFDESNEEIVKSSSKIIPLL